jgi:tetratricopeptide (TPR) repeat protein
MNSAYKAIVRPCRIVTLHAIVGLLLLFLALAASGFPQEIPPSTGASTRDAAAALAAGDLKRADNELQAVLRTTPTDVHALNLLGIVRAQQKRETEAESLFKQAIEIQPDFAGAHASLGLLYVQMGKDDLAISPLQEAIRLDPARKDAQSALINIWRSQAHAAVQHGNSEKALALLISARKLNASDTDLQANVQYDLGMVALRMSLFPDAIDAFSEVLKIRPEDDRALYALGRAKIATAKFDDAQQAFAHYIQLRPADASGHYALGVALQALQRSSDARAEYKKSITLQPLQTEAYFQLGSLDLEAGNIDAAREKFEQVLKRAPQHVGALNGLGRVRFHEKKYSDAATLFEKAIAANSESREAHYYLGLTDARLSKKEESEKELQTASRIEHGEVERHQNMLRILDPDQIQSEQIQPDQTHGAASNPNQ